jgi:hypothetical protein
MGWPPRQIFLFACVTAAIATVSVVLLRVQVRRSDPLAVPREA